MWEGPHGIYQRDGVPSYSCTVTFDFFCIYIFLKASIIVPVSSQRAYTRFKTGKVAHETSNDSFPQGLFTVPKVFLRSTSLFLRRVLFSTDSTAQSSSEDLTKDLDFFESKNCLVGGR